ncbi:GTP-binding protein 1 [Neolecta irregularis DAH-3]|uniref:GTP-binding protein 1 n=1 Tax=Neolecta irregularis (strain DAH-3) TaxID=1198029 RepID=A0A1U7LKI1_NEOID|nr:GTP-binding protein 1 [Neolecta irregularis DAH-3]|eukprot:OLL23103.1 GTP-binding protein 1 [Neolecta irregularis DAH-3]
MTQKRPDTFPADSAQQGDKDNVKFRQSSDIDDLMALENLGLADDEIVSVKECLLSGCGYSKERLKQELDFRIRNGRGECLFDIGFEGMILPLDKEFTIEENGKLMNLTKDEYQRAFETLQEISASIEAKCVELSIMGLARGEASCNDKGVRAKIMIRKIAKAAEEILEIRVAVVGNVDSGKSTTLGVLTKNSLDDGRGKARVNLFRHKHEIESGRTSSVGMEILGFSAASEAVSGSVGGRKLSWEEISKKASKLICTFIIWRCLQSAFVDLAGHEKYLKTTVFGMTGCAPDYVMLMVGANAGLVGMSKEHLGLALALNVPVFVVITKIDMCPPNVLEQTIKQLTRILKSPGCRKIPIYINSMTEVVSTASHFVSERVCPIFQISNVTGLNLELLRTFLNIIPFHGEYHTDQPLEYAISDTFSVPFVGCVVSGVVNRGIVHVGDNLLIGPDASDQFIPTSVRSIQRKRVNVPCASAGQSASFALKKLRRRDVRKGMFLLSNQTPLPRASREFLAEVLVLYHQTTIKPKYQAMLHTSGTAQTAQIVSIDKPILRTGDRGLVRFRFMQRAYASFFPLCTDVKRISTTGFSNIISGGSN